MHLFGCISGNSLCEYPDPGGGMEWVGVMSVRWEGKCASVLWHGVIDRCLATPPCSRRVDKGVEKGVETLSRFHGSVTGSRSLCHPLASWYTGHASPCHAPPLSCSCVCSCRCRKYRIYKLCKRKGNAYYAFC